MLPRVHVDHGRVLVAPRRLCPLPTLERFQREIAQHRAKVVTGRNAGEREADQIGEMSGGVWLAGRGHVTAQAARCSAAWLPAWPCARPASASGA